MYFSGKQKLCLIAIILLAVVVAGVSVALILKDKDGEGIIVPKSATLARGAIVTNGHECAGIGRDILLKGGSAVDAALAALVCEGIAMPQSTGVGGGFFMTIYSKELGIVETLNAREVAPLAATEDMYVNKTNASTEGGLAVAVPGEVRGYEYAHKKYGKLPWREILQPTIDLCRKGHLVTGFLAGIFEKNRDLLLTEPSFTEIYIDPRTGEPYKEGQHVKRLKLAETLEAIAKDGADALYNGALTKPFVDDIRKFGGIITVEDMQKYKPQWLPPIKADLPNGQTLYSFPLPGSGIIMSFILNLLKGFLDTTELDSTKNWQRIVESFKFAYGKRTLLGDPAFVPGIHELLANLTSQKYINATRKMISDVKTSQDPTFYGADTVSPDDHGTAHISVLAPNGDAVAVTGTINLIFGARIRSRSTGIILNDEMDDFSSKHINYFGMPSSPGNYIEPGKRPLSSMCPSIILNQDGSVRLVVGAAGGTKITTSSSLVTLKYLWYGEALDTAISDARVHHQLFPMSISAESNFSNVILNGLRKLGHNITIISGTSGFAAVTGVANNSHTIEAAFDTRRPGSVAYIS